MNHATTTAIRMPRMKRNLAIDALLVAYVDARNDRPVSIPRIRGRGHSRVIAGWIRESLYDALFARTLAYVNGCEPGTRGAA